MRLRDANFAAVVIGVPKQRIYELVRENFFPVGVVVRIGTRQLRFNEEALLDWIKAGGSVQPANGVGKQKQAVVAR